MSKDDWVAIVVDFLKNESFVIDPSLTGDVVLTPALITRLKAYEDKIEQWMQDSN